MKKLSKQTYKEVYCTKCGKIVKTRNKQGRTRCPYCKQNFVFDAIKFKIYCKKRYALNPYNPDKYINIKKRRFELKFTRISEMGSKCQRCGYSKCWSILEFHHKDPSKKENRYSQGWSKVRGFNKEDFELLCSNCHAELHYLERVKNGVSINEEAF